MSKLAISLNLVNKVIDPLSGAAGDAVGGAINGGAICLLYNSFLGQSVSNSVKKEILRRGMMIHHYHNEVISSNATF